MSPTTRAAQRAELHRTIWRMANDLRGSVTGWDFKQYVLGTILYRFLSDDLTRFIDEQERRVDPTFSYAELDDQTAEGGRAATVSDKGFFILPSQLFESVRASARDDEGKERLNETLSAALSAIERSALGQRSEADFRGLFADIDVNSPRLGSSVAARNDRLKKILDAIGGLDLGDFGDHAIDAFGDAYEYLMTMYAANAGRSGGEYFTPQEVAELIARITTIGKTELNKVYDPACGSGSLLLNFAKLLGPDKVRRGYFGQEIELTTYNLARMNMLLHGIGYEKFDIALGDTLADPQHWDDEPFDAIVSNPPYSTNWAGDDDPALRTDERFTPAGVLAPKNAADLAFVMHALAWLAPNGTAAIVESSGVLFRGGNEQKIRKYLVDGNYIDAVIQLPANLFFGTPIAACVIVLKRSKNSNDVLFIDARREFDKAATKNVLSDRHRNRIVETLVQRQDVDGFAKLVSNIELGAADYNLGVATYTSVETEVEGNVEESLADLRLAQDGVDLARAKLHEALSAAGFDD
ncbi:type I restriction-modification system subunit M [Plantibacter sp. Mn2098]|uniref:type I restriction-modification system subunit M n=1 Tax=Plantibacter sp. Mn2098 TaxID=3395266 RepID=UPI003BCC7294